jgi:hypothetical protein
LASIISLRRLRGRLGVGPFCAAVVGVVFDVDGVVRCVRAIPPPVWVGSPGVGSARVGVGSKGIHPTSSSHTSGQACASLSVTCHTPLPSRLPYVKPTATRAGSPTERAIAAYEPANCSQYPACVVNRKRSNARSECPGSTLVSYVKFFGLRR